MPDGFATTARLAVKLLARDWRAGELSVLVIALLVAVTALTGVAFLTDRVGQAVELRASESLAADLRVASSRPLDPAFAEQAAQRNLQTARLTSMPILTSPTPPCSGTRLEALRPAALRPQSSDSATPMGLARYMAVHCKPHPRLKVLAVQPARPVSARGPVDAPPASGNRYGEPANHRLQAQRTA